MTNLLWLEKVQQRVLRFAQDDRSSGFEMRTEAGLSATLRFAPQDAEGDGVFLVWEEDRFVKRITGVRLSIQCPKGAPGWERPWVLLA